MTSALARRCRKSVGTGGISCHPHPCPMERSQEGSDPSTFLQCYWLVLVARALATLCSREGASP